MLGMFEFKIIPEEGFDKESIASFMICPFEHSRRKTWFCPLKNLLFLALVEGKS